MKYLTCLFFFISTLFFGCNTPKEVLSSNQITKPNSGYWQQHVDYTMEIDMDVNTYKYEGVQKLVYTNNSPDVLDKV